MNLVGNYVGGMASNWIASTVEGAKEAAVSYGGNLAGDLISSGGNLIEGAGRQVGGGVTRYIGYYGDWVSGHGDKLRGAPASALPKSGPLAAYKGSGAGAGALKRSASYGPAMTASKALTKTSAGVKGTSGNAISKAKTTVGSGVGATAGAVKPYTTFVKDADKENDVAAARKRKAKKKPVNGSVDPALQPVSSKVGATPKPTGLGRTQSLPPGAKGTKKALYTPPSTKTVNGVKKTSISASSKPAPKPYTPYKAADKPQGLASQTSGGGHIPLPGGLGDSKGGARGAKGYTPYKSPAGDTKPKSGGAGPLGLPSSITDMSKTGGGPKDYKPYTPAGKGSSGGSGADKKIDRTFF